MKLSIRLVFGNPALICVGPAGFVPSLPGNRPGNDPLPVNAPVPIRFALNGFTLMPRLRRLEIASGILLSGSPPSETVAGGETRFELLTKPRMASYAPK